MDRKDIAEVGYFSLRQCLQRGLAPRSLSYGHLPEPAWERPLFIKMNADLWAKEDFQIADLLSIG
jgi:hypothetical protein